MQKRSLNTALDLTTLYGPTRASLSTETQDDMDSSECYLQNCSFQNAEMSRCQNSTSSRCVCDAVPFWQEGGRRWERGGGRSGCEPGCLSKDTGPTRAANPGHLGMESHGWQSEFSLKTSESSYSEQAHVTSAVHPYSSSAMLIRGRNCLFVSSGLWASNLPWEITV